MLDKNAIEKEHIIPLESMVYGLFFGFLLLLIYIVQGYFVGVEIRPFILIITVFFGTFYFYKGLKTHRFHEIILGVLIYGINIIGWL